MKQIFKFIAPYWKKGLFPILYLAISTAISLVYPLFPKWAIDEAIKKHNMNMLIILSLSFLFLILIQRFFLYLNEITFYKFQTNTVFNIQKRLINTLFSYPLEFFDKSHSGYLIGRIRGDVVGMNYIFSETLIENLMDFIKSIGILAILLTISSKLAIISLTVIPLLVYKVNISKTRVKEMNERVIEENARVERELSDTLQGIEVFKSFSKETEGIKRAVDGLERHHNIEVKRNNVFSQYRNEFRLIFHIWEALLFFLGIAEVIQGRLTIGGYVAFSAYLLFLYTPLKNMADFSSMIDYAKRSFKRIEELLNILPEEGGTVALEHVERIEVKNVRFFYQDGKKVLEDVSFKINKGDKVLLKGESGRGKSTMIKLLLGLYRPDEGEILFNDINISNFCLKKLREKIGYISQNIFLFNSTIKENILLGNESVTDDELMEILGECKLDTKITNLEKGIYEKVSEKGLNFSGGQKQKIALARALVKKPDVIIIDEGTSNIDLESEKEILEILEDKFKEKIIIRVTHRVVDLGEWKEIVF